MSDAERALHAIKEATVSVVSVLLLLASIEENIEGVNLDLIRARLAVALATLKAMEKEVTLILRHKLRNEPADDPKAGASVRWLN